MTIKLKADVKTKLVASIAEGLAKVVPESTFYHQGHFRWADALMAELDEEARSKLEKYCGDAPMPHLIDSVLTERQHQLSLTDGAVTPNRPLTETKFASHPFDVARDVVAKLESVPLRYQLTLALPRVFSDPILNHFKEEAKLPGGVIVRPGHTIAGKLPTSSTNLRVDSGLFRDFFSGESQDREIKGDRIYFTMPILGVVMSYVNSAVRRDFEDYVKAFYGACMAMQMVDLSWEPTKDQLPYVMIHDQDQKTLIATEKLDEDMLAIENRLSSAKFAEKHGENTDAWFEAALTVIGSIFGSEVDSRKIFLACLWYYRAKLNKRPLDALLEATIAIEVLLGDQKGAEGVGLSNMLGSRCAFLIGKTTGHREAIMDSFHKIYKLRSSIVHAGKHHPTKAERLIVNSAKNLCRDIIAKELMIRRPKKE